MEASKELWRQIDDITECPICAESFKEPKVLPCIHTFCLHCLEKYCQEKEKNPGDTVDCPICRKGVTIPLGGFKELPNNYFIIQLMQINQLSSSSESEPTEQKTGCDVCLSRNLTEKSTATGFCIECSQHLCESCTDMHKVNKFLRTHQVVKLEDKPSVKDLIKMATSFCQQHQNKEIEFYCYDCKTTACVVCYVDKHNTHKCSDVKKSAEEFRVQLSQDIDRVALMASTIRNQKEMNQFDTELSKLTANCETVRSEITQQFEKFRSLMEQHKNELMEELSAFQQKRVKEYETRKDELERQFVIMDSFKRYCDELKEKGTSSEISRAAGDLHIRADDLMKSGDELMRKRLSFFELCFAPSQVTTDNVKNLIGELSFKETVCKLEEVDFKAVSLLIQPTVKVHEISSKCAELRGITVLGSDVFVASESLNHIEVYNLNTFTFIRQLPLAGQAKGRALAACSHHNCLYVSTADNKAILHRFDLAKLSSSQWTLSARCWGLSTTRSFNLLITLNDTKRIQEYTTLGNLIREIAISAGNPYYSAQLSSGDFIFTQIGTEHKVCLVNSTGKIIKSYGGPRGSGDGHLNGPFQATVDKSDNVIVADYINNRIVLLSHTLELLGYIKTPGHELVDPWAVHLDTVRGCLYVGEFYSCRVLAVNVAIPDRK